MLFAFTHVWNGQSTVLPTLDNRVMPMDTQIVFTYVWHIITVENLIIGAAFIIMSVQREQSKSRFAAWMIVLILVFRLLVILGTTLLYDTSAIVNTLVDSAAIVIYVALIILGIKMKNRRHEEQPSQSSLA